MPKNVYMVVVERRGPSGTRMDDTIKVVANTAWGALSAVLRHEVDILKSSIDWVYWHADAEVSDLAIADHVTNE